jgi:hypothetical protein
LVSIATNFHSVDFHGDFQLFLKNFQTVIAKSINQSSRSFYEKLIDVVDAP